MSPIFCSCLVCYLHNTTTAEKTRHSHPISQAGSASPTLAWTAPLAARLLVVSVSGCSSHRICVRVCRSGFLPVRYSVLAEHGLQAAGNRDG